MYLYVYIYMYIYICTYIHTYILGALGFGHTISISWNLFRPFEGPLLYLHGVSRIGASCETRETGVAWELLRQMLRGRVAADVITPLASRREPENWRPNRLHKQQHSIAS